MIYLRKKLFSLTISSLAPLRTSLPRISGGNPNFTLFGSKNSFSSFSTQPNSAHPSLVGWWAGVSRDHKDPYGQIILISEEQGRYLARSYSPWQLATAKDGTPLFEIYGTTSLEGEYKEQAIYLKHKEVPQDSLGSLQNMLDMCFFHLIPPNKISPDQWAESLRRVAAADGNDTSKEEFKKLLPAHVINKEDEGDEANEVAMDSGEGKTVIYNVFAVGDIVKKVRGNLNKDLIRVPATLEREKGCFSFSVSVEEEKDQQVSGDHSLIGHHTIDHVILERVDCYGRGIYKKKRRHDKLWRILIHEAQNQQPVLLSGLTTFNRIDIPAPSDPLNGLYIGSNGYLVTEVIQVRRKFSHCSKLESCDYVEVVKLTGDPDVPAGQVVFTAKIGDKYKLPPGSVLEEKFGAVARYKGEGRLAGFQNSTWVNVEVFIVGEEYRKDGLGIGFLYSAPDYYFLKMFKQLRLQSFRGSH